MKAQIKNALTLPMTILQMLIDKKPPPKSAVKGALVCIEEIIDSTLDIFSG
jgi:hypothetical protein